MMNAQLAQICGRRVIGQNSSVIQWTAIVVPTESKLSITNTREESAIKTPKLLVWVLLLGLGFTGCSTFKLSKQTLSEPSGLAASSHHADVFWTHDDSGGNPEIFAVNRDGKVLGVFKIEGADANDWEAIATDRQGKLYIGDFGNNRNTRRDLVIYQVREPSFEPGTKPILGTTKVERSVRFFYPEQTKFPDKKQKNFDAEALFWNNGSLYLLTKHRSDMSTTLYTVPIQESAKPLPLRSWASLMLAVTPTILVDG